MLRSDFFSPEQVEAIARDYRNAGLEPAEVAAMAFAEKVTHHAYKVSPEDIDTLHSHGYSDSSILDIILAVSARNYFSRVLDATGTEPDDVYLNLEPSLREALTTGTPLGEAEHAPR